MDEYREQHRELLARFEAALKPGSEDAWFDEFELLDIIDYAGDIGNDYIRTEALLWGARHYPDSKALRERKCVFYSDVLPPQAVISFAENNPDCTNPATEILLNLAKGVTGKFAEEYLNSLLERYKSLGDEDLIQVVNFAFDTNNKQWLYSHMPDLRARTQFTPPLTFEVAVRSREEGDIDVTIPLLEELVEDAPYCIEYWYKLTTAYFAADRKKEALSALDMTLAIDPDYLPALRTKANLLSLQGNIDAVEKLYNKYPDDQDIALAYMNTLLIENLDNNPEKRSVIIEQLLKNIEQFPTEEKFVDYLLALEPDKAEPVLETLWENLRDYTSDEEVTDQWSQWIDKQINGGNFQGARVLLEFYFSHDLGVQSPTVDRMMVIETLIFFLSQRWEEAYNNIVNNRTEAMRANHMIYVAEVMCLIRLRKFDEARRVAESFVQQDPEFSISPEFDWTGIGQATILGLSKFTNDVLLDLQDNLLPYIDADRYDPLFLWHD
jgi:tetratricopeptide (TPR) repeat protein